MLTIANPSVLQKTQHHVAASPPGSSHDRASSNQDQVHGRQFHDHNPPLADALLSGTRGARRCSEGLTTGGERAYDLAMTERTPKEAPIQLYVIQQYELYVRTHEVEVRSTADAHSATLRR